MNYSPGNGNKIDMNRNNANISNTATPSPIRKIYRQYGSLGVGLWKNKQQKGAYVYSKKNQSAQIIIPLSLKHSPLITIILPPAIMLIDTTGTIHTHT